MTSLLYADWSSALCQEALHETINDISVREAKPAPPFVAQLKSRGLEPVLVVPADEVWKDGKAPLEAEGPVACPNSEVEAAGWL